MSLYKVGPLPGYAREATVKYIDLSHGTMRIVLNMAKSDSLGNQEYDIDIPATWAGPAGEFSGGCPVIGSTIWVITAAGGRWAALPYAPSEGIFGNRNSTTASSYRRNLMASLQPGRWLTQVQNNIRIIADPKIGIQIGSPNDYLQADPNSAASHRSIFSYRFKQALGFTDASRKIDGPVRRDLSSNSTRDVSGSALSSHVYDESLTTIGLDPKTKAGISGIRNPPFAEVRHVVYEFSNSYGFSNDSDESSMYDTGLPKQVPAYFPRRESRADILSLSLNSPNYLMENVKGTVVDVYGNLIDINRNILPSGSIDELSFSSNQSNKSQTFINLREQTRKTIAYHFELNARKEKVPDKSDLLPQSTSASGYDYARNRSRFFIDIDKEGQFKINIPMSSEVGNIPLLTRYENYSTLKAAQEDTNQNEFIRSQDDRDIYLDSYGVGVISLNGNDQALDGYAAPVDRISGKPIKLGTVYHDLQLTAELHNRGADDPTLLPMQFDPDNKLNNRTVVPLAGDIVSQKVIVSGDSANAGGRSGTISLDGSISLSIGANTVDRQSVWLDTAGGMVLNVGRDRNGRSLVSRMDGDVLIQVGGATVANDSRFGNENNAVRDGTVDIRVGVNAQMTIVRIDSSGVRIATPGELDIESAGTLRLKSKSDVIIDGESIYFYSGKGTIPRWVRRQPGQTI